MTSNLSTVLESLDETLLTRDVKLFIKERERKVLEAVIEEINEIKSTELPPEYLDGRFKDKKFTDIWAAAQTLHNRDLDRLQAKLLPLDRL